MQNVLSSISADAQICALARQLEDNGYLILPNMIEPTLLNGVKDQLAPHFEDAAYCTGPFYGETTRRFGRAFMRSTHSHQLALHSTILDIVEQVIGRHCSSVQLNLTQGIEIWPGAPAQVPHRDHDMWNAPKGDMEYMINVMWALDDFTESNGATRIWPGSNRLDQNEMRPDDEAVSAVMPAGSACLFLGSTLHSGGANHSDLPRRGLIISYCQGWLKPWENQWLAYPPDIAKHFPPELAALVGYRQHLPSLGNYEGQCPSVLLSDAPGWSPFVDALREDQFELIRAYYDKDLQAA